MVKKIIIVVLFVFIALGFGYFVSLTKEPRQENSKASSTSSDSTICKSSKQNTPSFAERADIQQEISDNLSKYYKKPIAEVIKEYEAKLQKNPEDVEAHLELGQIYNYFPDKHQEALNHLQTVLKLKPDHPKKESLDAQIRIYLLRSHDPAATAKLKEEQEQWKKNPTALASQYAKLAERYENKKVYDIARYYYQKAVRLEPKNAEYHLAYAKVCMEKWPKEAITHLETVLKLKPAHPEKADIEKWMESLKKELGEKRNAK